MEFTARMLTGLLAVLLSVAGNPVQAQVTRPRIAVLEFQPVRADDAEATAAADQLRNELVNLHVFTVLDRGETEAILGELAFQREGLTDPSQAVALGKLLNVEYVVTGRLTRLRAAYQVNVQMIDVESAEIVRSESIIHQGDFIGLVTGRIPRLAARLAQVEPAAPPAVLSAPVTPAPTAPLAERPRSSGRSPWMMHRWPPDWSLVAGGMMVMGAAMMAARTDGENRDAALAVGAVGLGLLGYYLISGGASRAAASADGDTVQPRRFVDIDLKHVGVRAGIAWRW